MKSNQRSREEKVEKLQMIIQSMNDVQIDALLLLLERNSPVHYSFPESEMSIVAENYERYNAGKVGGISAQESVRRLNANLKKLRKKK